MTGGGNNPGGQIKTNAAVDMAAFDELPPAVREALREQPYDVSSVLAYGDIVTGKYDEATLVGILRAYRDRSLEHWRAMQRAVAMGPPLITLRPKR